MRVAQRVRPCLGGRVPTRGVRWGLVLRRGYSSGLGDVVEVRCGSSGSVTVTLNNISSLDIYPLILYIPPPLISHPSIKPPSFLSSFPTATIHYRWEHPSSFPEPALHWPTPLHDVVAAYTYLQEKYVGDAGVYVYSSHGGACLGASLALTESRFDTVSKSEARSAGGPKEIVKERGVGKGVRGFIGYNGIYNWTMFLPDHRIHQTSTSKRKSILSPPRVQLPEEQGALSALKNGLPELFPSPKTLFDPFASPALFFQTPGIHIPPSFTQPRALSLALDALSDSETFGENVRLVDEGLPRRSPLLFPPRLSDLRIPNFLLLYDEFGGLGVGKGRGRKKGHSFAVQAGEFEALLKRGVVKSEARPGNVWDEGEGVEVEAEKRVRTVSLGEGDGWEMGGEGEELISDWLDEVC